MICCKKRWLIAGLGNPGSRYEDTWHNMGRMAVSELARRNDLLLGKRRFGGITTDGVIAGERVLLLQPETYMNNSGESIIRAMAYYRIPADRLIVIYDDFDLLLGHLRIRDHGGAGSHNGMKSILQHVKDGRFLRVRIGTGPVRGDDVVAFVLSRVPKAEERAVCDALQDASEIVELLLAGKMREAQERFNKKGPAQDGGDSHA